MALGVEPPHPPSPQGSCTVSGPGNLDTPSVSPQGLLLPQPWTRKPGAPTLLSDAVITTHAPERTDRTAEEFGDDGGTGETRSLQRQDRKVGYGGEPEGRPQRGRERWNTQSQINLNVNKKRFRRKQEKTEGIYRDLHPG